MGDWDPEKKTLTQVSLPDANGIVMQSVSKVINEDQVDWTVVTRNPVVELEQKPCR